MNRLIGKKGTIDIINLEDKPKRLRITTSQGEKIVPFKELNKYIKELQIYTTANGGISFGNWGEQ